MPALNLSVTSLVNFSLITDQFPMKTKQHIGSLMVATLLTGSMVIAQTTDQYKTAMTGLITRMDTTQSVDGNLQTANAFSRVANAEKDKWLPYYYGALCTVTAAFSEPSIEKIDPLCQQATQLLDEADRISPNNSEVYCVKAMIVLAGIKVNMMQRGMQGIMKAQANLEKAAQLDAENPRAYYLMGQQSYNTPEKFGGSKKEALAFFEKAVELAEKQKDRANTIDVNWGRKPAERQAANCRKLLQLAAK
jgi:hypothetical protein